MKRQIKKILCSLIGISLVISTAGCNQKPSGTIQSDAETATTTTIAAEAAAEEAEAFL